jgi:hypothetical protein
VPSNQRRNLIPYEFLTTAQVAAALGLTQHRVRALARSRGVGWAVNGRAWLFQPEDIERLRPLPPGRPRRISEGSNR